MKVFNRIFKKRPNDLKNISLLSVHLQGLIRLMSDANKRFSDADSLAKIPRSPNKGYLNEESPLPYDFDMIDYYLIDNAALKDHIDRVGMLIYPESYSLNF